ncbi:MAG: cell division ATP-binding protein FtsE, partial [Patescibacteria group bacterium]
TVILTTHNKGIIDSLGKRVIAMEKGKIVRDDKKGKYEA